MTTTNRAYKARYNAAKKARIQASVSGFVIPMLSIPKLYKALDVAVDNGLSDADLKAIVAAFPGVSPS